MPSPAAKRTPRQRFITGLFREEAARSRDADKGRPVFLFALQATAGIPDIQAAKRVLKALWRRHGLKCVDCGVVEPVDKDSNASAG